MGSVHSPGLQRSTVREMAIPSCFSSYNGSYLATIRMLCNREWGKRVGPQLLDIGFAGSEDALVPAVVVIVCFGCRCTVQHIITLQRTSNRRDSHNSTDIQSYFIYIGVTYILLPNHPKQKHQHFRPHCYTTASTSCSCHSSAR